MADVIGKVSGGKAKEFSGIETVKELRVEMNLDRGYTATVNGEPEDDSYELSPGDFVAFAPAVKGGR